jgi:peptide/nickel transport system ATP-binding protein
MTMIGESRHKAGAGRFGAPLIELRNLSVSFPKGMAVHGVDLEIAPGEALGLVGESGSGKSVTWLAVLGLLSGKSVVKGEALLSGENLIGLPDERMARIRGRRIGLILQDPVSALNPVKRVGAQVAEALRLHRGLNNAAAKVEVRRLFDQVGIPDAARRMHLYPHELSGGQNQRVMIAMALAGQPELLIADEPTTALDVTIQAQILSLLEELQRDLGMALVLISHDLSVVGELCDRIAVMYAGRIVETAPAWTLLTKPSHPYTRGLLDAAPLVAEGHQWLLPIPGQVPEPWNMPPGCAFSSRCRFARNDCRNRRPKLAPIAPRQASACLHANDIALNPADPVADVDNKDLSIGELSLAAS